MSTNCPNTEIESDDGQSLKASVLNGILRIDREGVGLFNEIFSKNRPIEIDYHQDRYSAIFLPASVPYAPQIGIKVQVGQHVGWIGFDTLDFIEMLSGANIIRLPLEIKRAFFEAAFEPVLNWFEVLSGTKIAVREIYFEPAHIENYGYDFFFRSVRESDHFIINGSVSWDRAGLKWLAGLFRRLPPLPPAIDPDLLTVTANVEVGRTRLFLKEWERLEQYDIVLIERYTGKREIKRLRLRFSDTCYFEGYMEDRLLTIDEKREDSMSAATDLPKVASIHEKSIACLDEMDIDLVFEVGFVTLPMTKIKQLRPGSILDVGQPLDKPVTVKVNGRTVGRGEFVQIEKHLGVRLVELAV